MQLRTLPNLQRAFYMTRCVKDTSFLVLHRILGTSENIGVLVVSKLLRASRARVWRLNRYPKFSDLPIWPASDVRAERKTGEERRTAPATTVARKATLHTNVLCDYDKTEQKALGFQITDWTGNLLQRSICQQRIAGSSWQYAEVSPSQKYSKGRERKCPGKENNSDQRNKMAQKIICQYKGCGKAHKTEECWNDPKNMDKRPKF